MKVLPVAVVACLAGVTGAIHLQQKDKPAVVEASIQRRALTVPPHERDRRRRLAKRAPTLSVDLDNEVNLYYVDAYLGTPQQRFRLHIDTGSSDLWVNTLGDGASPLTTGTYDADSSSTYRYVSSDFNISYVDGSGAAGDYVTDDLYIGTTVLNDFQFGVAYSSSSREGVLGIGYAVNEVQVNRAGKQPYPNLPEALVNSGLAASRAYSLWLNDLEAHTGTILFGGIDTNRYDGDLKTLPIIPYGTSYIEFIIALTGVSSGGTSYMSGEPVPVLLDSGSSLTYLPNSTVQMLFERYNVRYSEVLSAGEISCDAADQGGTIDFDFSGVIISVPLSELVTTVASSHGASPVCAFGIAALNRESYVLGDSFLRSAYVVYDLENNSISLAQTVYNATQRNIVEITSVGVPFASQVTSAVSTVAGLPTGRVAINGGNVGVDDESAGAVAASLPSLSMYAFAAAAVAFGAAWHDLRIRRAW